MDEFLNVALVAELRRGKGVSIKWMIQQLGLSKTTGYMLFQKGLLPENRSKKREILTWLSKYLGVEVGKLLLRLEAKETA